MYVFGGSTVMGDHEKDAYSDLETACISDQILVYDIKCDSWSSILRHDTARRIGHTTESYIAAEENGNVYPRVVMFGGFNSTIIASMSYFSPGPINLKEEEERECPDERNMSNWSCAGESMCNNCLSAKQNKCGYCAHTADSMSTGSSAPDACQVSYFDHAPLPGMSYPRSSALFAGGTCPTPIWLKQTSQCRSGGEVQALCDRADSCTNCVAHQECSWITSAIGTAAEKSFCTRKPENVTNVDFGNSMRIIMPGEYQKCSKKDACYEQKNCHACLNLQCLFCNNRCISKDGYVSEFPYGRCPRLKRFSTVLTGIDECPVGNIDNINEFDECLAYKSCEDCHKHSSCGWCDFGENSGLGACYKGGNNGPDQEGKCDSKLNRVWHFIDCPECQCNGHSTCKVKYESDEDYFFRIDASPEQIAKIKEAEPGDLGDAVFSESEIPEPQDYTISSLFGERKTEHFCHNCEDLTTGPHCEECSPGFWGDPRNGGECEKCECHGRAEMCMHNTGECLCNTMWTSGEKCDKCLKPSQDMNFRRYWSNVTPEYTCFIELPINFEYTFTLNRKHESYIKRLNAIAFPDIDLNNPDQELIITIETSSPVTVQFTMGSTYTDDPNTDNAASIDPNISPTDGNVLETSENTPNQIEILKNLPKSEVENCSKSDNQCEHFLLQTMTEKRAKNSKNGLLLPNVTNMTDGASTISTLVTDASEDVNATSLDLETTEADLNLTEIDSTVQPTTDSLEVTEILSEIQEELENFEKDVNLEDLSSNATQFFNQTSESPQAEDVRAKSENLDAEEDDPGKLNYELRYIYKFDENKAKANTSIRIYITDFKTPILLKIRVSKSSEVDLIMFFTIFFSCFLSLLVTAFIGWRIKAAYDDFHRRQQQELELMRMAARPFNNITIRCDQDARNPFMENKKEAIEAPTAIAKQPFMGDKLAVLTFVVWLPGERTNIMYYPDDDKTNPPMKTLCTPHGHTAIGLGTSLVKLLPNDTEFGPNAQTFESMAERRARELKERKKKEKHQDAVRAQVDPSQSKGTTTRIEKWLADQPAEPDKDKFVEDLNNYPLPAKLKDCKPRTGDGDKYSITILANPPPREPSLGPSLGSAVNISGNVKDRLTARERSRAASRARSEAAAAEEDLDIQLGEEAGGINGGEDEFQDPMMRGFVRDTAPVMMMGTGRNDDVKMM